MLLRLLICSKLPLLHNRMFFLWCGYLRLVHTLSLSHLPFFPPYFLQARLPVMQYAASVERGMLDPALILFHTPSFALYWASKHATNKPYTTIYISESFWVRSRRMRLFLVVGEERALHWMLHEAFTSDHARDRRHLSFLVIYVGDSIDLSISSNNNNNSSSSSSTSVVVHLVSFSQTVPSLSISQSFLTGSVNVAVQGIRSAWFLNDMVLIL